MHASRKLMIAIVSLQVFGLFGLYIVLQNQPSADTLNVASTTIDLPKIVPDPVISNPVAVLPTRGDFSIVSNPPPEPVPTPTLLAAITQTMAPNNELLIQTTPTPTPTPTVSITPSSSNSPTPPVTYSLPPSSIPTSTPSLPTPVISLVPSIIPSDIATTHRLEDELTFEDAKLMSTPPGPTQPPDSVAFISLSIVAALLILLGILLALLRLRRTFRNLDRQKK